MTLADDVTTKGGRVPDAFQLFKPLPPNVEAALRASIDRFGVLVAVVKDQHGRILVGDLPEDPS